MNCFVNELTVNTEALTNQRNLCCRSLQFKVDNHISVMYKYNLKAFEVIPGSAANRASEHKKGYNSVRFTVI